MEELPEPHKIKKFTQLYLIPESLLCIYLLFCVCVVDSKEDHDSTVDDYRKANLVFIFICLIPFMAARIIALLCCTSLRTIPC